MNDDRFRGLTRQWRRHPPVHWLVAGFVGHKPPADDATPGSAPHSTAAALKAAFPGGRLSP